MHLSHDTSHHTSHLHIINNKATTSKWPWQWPFRTNATINQRNNGSVNSNTLIVNSLCFFRLVDCRLAAKIADLVKMAPTWANQPWDRRFWRGHGPFLPKKIHLVERDDKLDGTLTSFYISTFYNSWAAPNGHCCGGQLDESGLRRWVFLSCGRKCMSTYRRTCSL